MCSGVNLVHLFSGIRSCPCSLIKAATNGNNQKHKTHLERGFWISGCGAKCYAMNKVGISVTYLELCSAVMNNATLFCFLNAGVFASYINVFTCSPSHSDDENITNILGSMSTVM